MRRGSPDQVAGWQDVGWAGIQADGDQVMPRPRHRARTWNRPFLRVPSSLGTRLAVCVRGNGKGKGTVNKTSEINKL